MHAKWKKQEKNHACKVEETRKEFLFLPLCMHEPLSESKNRNARAAAACACIYICMSMSLPTMGGWPGGCARPPFLERSRNPQRTYTPETRSHTKHCCAAGGIDRTLVVVRCLAFTAFARPLYCCQRTVPLLLTGRMWCVGWAVCARHRWPVLQAPSKFPNPKFFKAGLARYYLLLIRK